MKKRYIKYRSLVIYHNKFNLVPLLDFTPLEHNLLFSLFRDMKSNDDKLDYYWSIQEIKDMVKESHLVISDTVKLIDSLTSKFFHCNFKLISPKAIEYFHLFSSMRIEYENDDKAKPIGLTIRINKDAIDVFKGLKENFTSFSLDTFKALKSAYSKNLFRLLSQYSTSGRYKVDYNELRGLLDVPKNYQYGMFNHRILSPAVKEISNNFYNLKFKVIKDRENGKLVHKFIEFTFKPYKNSSSNQIKVEKSKNNKELFALRLASDILNKEAIRKANNNEDYSKELNSKTTLDILRYRKTND